MLDEKDLITAEELIFYIDLTTDYIKKEILLNELKEFIKSKKKLGEASFGILIFQEEDNPVFLYDQKDSEQILNLLQEKWETRPKSQSFIENGLFEVLSHVFKNRPKNNKVCRVIIISDTPTVRSNEYYQAVYNLILKSKQFSMIVDIIRVGDQEYYVDSVKLNVISSETHGGVFFCNDKQFIDVISSLVKSKQEFNVIQIPDEENQDLKEDKTFYERLAADLISLEPNEEERCNICQFELCPVCGAYSDEITKCFNCGTKFHGCCIARYSISKNIGFRHIFKCPHCQNLLKLEEDFVELIYEEDLEDGIIYDESIELFEVSKVVEKQTPEAPQEQPSLIEILQEQDPIIETPQEQPPVVGKISIDKAKLPPPPPVKLKVGGFFGREIEVGNVSEAQEKKDIVKEPTEKVIQNNSPSITKLTPPKKRTKMKFCKICGCTVITIVCPNCHSKID